MLAFCQATFCWAAFCQMVAFSQTAFHQVTFCQATLHQVTLCGATFCWTLYCRVAFYQKAFCQVTICRAKCYWGLFLSDILSIIIFPSIILSSKNSSLLQTLKLITQKLTNTHKKLYNIGCVPIAHRYNNQPIILIYHDSESSGLYWICKVQKNEQITW